MLAFARRFRERMEKRKRKRKLEEQLDRCYKYFEPDLAKADTLDKQQQLEAQRDYECSEFDDEIQRLDSLDLAAGAQRRHIDISDLGPPPEPHSNHWIQGQHGVWFLHPQSLRALCKAVEEAEYQHAKRELELKDFWWKFITAIAASIGAIMGILNFLRRSS